MSQVWGAIENMTGRKNLKIDPDTYNRLKDEKGRFETWDAMLNRLVDETGD